MIRHTKAATSTNHRRAKPSRLAAILIISIAAGCSTLEKTTPALVPSSHVTRTGSFAVYTGTPIPKDSPAIQSLTGLEAQMAKRLGVQGHGQEPAVEIYVLKDREAFNHFLTFYYPELPNRRAFFLAQGSKRVIYTFENERLQEDLRHEATHALLHEGVGNLPLWLDEGLAEYFEGPDRREGANPDHLTRLPADLEKGWKPDLKRLEQIKGIKDMTPRDYRESWAWIHYLLDSNNEVGRATLLSYLADIQANENGEAEVEPLSARLDQVIASSGQKMLGHLQSVPTAKSDVAATRVSNPSKVLLQSRNETPEPDLKPADQRGFFAKALGLFGIKVR